MNLKMGTETEERGGLNVFIAEDIPSHNKGEGALFFGIAESLRALGRINLKIISTNPASDRKYYSDTAAVIDGRGIIPEHFATGAVSCSFPAKAWNYSLFLGKLFGFVLCYAVMGKRVLTLYRHPFWKALLTSDLIIAGHDSAWTPFYHGPLLFFFRMIKIPSVVYGATVRPARAESAGMRRRVSELLTCRSLKAASLVTLRETLSIQALQAAGFNGPAPAVYPDLALLMQPAAPEKVDRILERERVPLGRPLVGMAFSRRVLRRALPHLAQDEERIDAAVAELAKAIDDLIEEHGVRVVFVPHSIGPTPNLDDRIIGDRIIAKVRNKDLVVNMRGDYDPREIKGLCGRLALSVGSRLHFTIDSTAMGVPALLLAYEGDLRCHGIIGELFPGTDMLLPVEKLSAKTLGARLRDAWHNRQQLSGNVARAAADARMRCLHGHKVAALFEEK